MCGRGGPRGPPAGCCPLCRRAAESATANGTSSSAIPEPVVKIDNESDPFATIVSVEYGDRLGELLDTVRLVADRGGGRRRSCMA